MASNINRVIVGGRLTRDAELRMAGSVPMISFSIASNERRKVDGEWTDVANYIDCVMFGSRVEKLVDMLRKGIKLVVEGTLRYRSWEAQDGSKRSKLEVAVDELELLSYASQKGSQGSSDDLWDDDIPFA